MAHRAGVTLAAVLFAAFLAPLAAAKGPIGATLEGPGLDAPIVFGGWSEDGAGEQGRFPLMPLVEAASFFPAAFGSYNATPVERPKGDLGPRYTVTYDLGRGPEGEKSLIVQDVYPYAEPRAVTYMAPGQPFYGSMETLGGWFVATSPHAPPMLFLLREAGLPRNPPSAGDDSPFPWLELAASTALGALLVVAVTSALLRRGPEQATT